MTFLAFTRWIGLLVFVLWAGGDAQAKGEDSNDMLAAADVVNGHTITTACGVCHSFDKGGPDIVGPNLFGIVGAKHAHEKNYAYSEGMKALKKQVWTTDLLDAWLKEPGAVVPGTRMAFGGLLDPQDRADVIAYLMTLK